MKVVILAGGFGTRISEETELKPKPMIEIGGKPIIWHIMKSYSHYGFNDFVICLGYKGYMIKEYFDNYYLHQCNITYDFNNRNKKTIHSRSVEPWKITLVDTGTDTMTGGRVKRIQEYIGNETFMLTYGDGLSNIPIDKLVNYHKGHGKSATITAIQPSGRFGILNMDEEDNVKSFMEKPKGDDSWVNGGFFVLEPVVFELISGDVTIWEREPLEKLAKTNNLKAYRHDGFWQSMDTLRDKKFLDGMWKTGNAVWKIWE